MAGQSATSPGICIWVFITLTLLQSVFHLVQCRDVTNFAVNQEPSLGLRVDLVHRDSPISPLSPGNITSTERLQRAVARSQARRQKIHPSVDKVKDVEAPVNSSGTEGGEFVLSLGIGTPPSPFLAILDTGSDLTWTQCNPCTNCSSQPDPIYDPSQSSTYEAISCTSSVCQDLSESNCTDNNECEYGVLYNDNSTTTGVLSYETLSFSSHSIPKIVFGCGQDNEGFQDADGIIGFGRGSLSLISQLGSSVGNTFSYCLVPVTSSNTSPLFIGQSASLKSKRVSSTPLIQSSSDSTFYYLSLKGISVGGHLLDIPDDTFDLQSDGSGGLMIDSGTTFTILQQPGYDALKEALNSSTSHSPVDGSSVGMDLCFDQQSGSSTSDFPTITFHFDGGDFVLPKENYLASDDSIGLLCLAILPSDSGSIFGNFQQQNFQILYDNERNLLSFAPTNCETL